MHPYEWVEIFDNSVRIGKRRSARLANTAACDIRYHMCLDVDVKISDFASTFNRLCMHTYT